MRRQTDTFKALFFKELRDSYHYPLAVVGVLLVGSLLFINWPYALHSSQYLGVLAVADALTTHFAGLWGRLAVFSVFIVAALLPAGTFARERQTKEIACLQRFPVSLQTVLAAKFSAAFVLTILVAVAFVSIGLGFDLLYGFEPFSALNAFCAQFDPHEIANLRAFVLSPLEIFVWGAFWATRIRRESLIVAASLLSTFAVWGLVGCVALSVEESPRNLALYDALRQDHMFQSVTVGGVASVESFFYAALRFSALLFPLVGIIRLFRRDGAKTIFDGGSSVRHCRFTAFFTERRSQTQADVSASVPVAPNASTALDAASPPVCDRFVSVTPCRLRPFAALCLESIRSASLFGRFRGATAIDLTLLNLLLFFNLTNPAKPAPFLVWLLFIALFGTGAFAGLRYDRSVLTRRLPVLPSVYYASQVLSYTALYIAAFLPAVCFQLLLPETADGLRNLIWPEVAGERLNLAQTTGACFLGAYHWFVVFCASAVVRSRIGAAFLCTLFYSAVFCLKVELYGFADGPVPPEGVFPLVYYPAFAVGVASYLGALRRFKRNGN